MNPTQVFLALGSNLGDRTANLRQAIQELSKQCRIIQQSHIYETEPWGVTDQPNFYNCVVEVTTELSAQKLLKKILEIERHLGRERNGKWQQRIIDIDILFYGNDIINEHGLHVPHPHLHERRFVLMPLAEIAPQLVHPTLKTTINELLNTVPETPAVVKL